MNELADRRREEKERRREDILAAAIAVAGSVGLEAMTMEQVARQARLSRALLYVYFADKNDLLTGLCEQALADLAERFRAAASADMHARDRLAAMGRAYVTFASTQPVLFEALARFEARGPGYPAPPGSQACLASGDEVHQLMVRTLREGVADGSIRANLGDPDAVATALWGLIHGIIQIAATKGALLERRGLDTERLLAQAMDLAHHALAPPESLKE